MVHSNITVTKVGKLPVWHVTSPNRITLAMTFIRMQEWYESPSARFYRKVFSLERYKKWYAKTHNGIFSYPNDWSGFNVPSTAVRAVYKEFRSHSPEEVELFNLLRKRGILERERFYLIGSTGYNLGVFDHEIRHALYFISPDYQREVEEVVRNIPTHVLRARLIDLGYAESVINDEIQAYVLTGLPRGLSPTRQINILRTALRRVEQKYLHLLPPR